MRRMKLRPSPPELVSTFQAVVPGPAVVTRKMFGFPAAFANGYMFAGLFEDQFIVRLSEHGRDELLADGGSLFQPRGRPMKEYLVVPPEIVADPRALSAWVKKALAYVKRLEPKRPKTPKKATKKKPPATRARAR
jgi:TfoX/Sxy family transcriptional regulator of competence genes